MLTVKKSDKKPELLNVITFPRTRHDRREGYPYGGGGDNQYYGFPVASPPPHGNVCLSSPSTCDEVMVI